MGDIKVNLGKRTYRIIVGSGVARRLGSLLENLGPHRDVFIITNKSIKARFGGIIQKSLMRHGFSVTFVTVADAETSKSIKTATEVIAKLAQYDIKKRLLIVALGGGVVGDLSGFVASIYKRGVAYIQIPTTLLAQVDSSIGGKTAVDLRQGKNLLGAFYQPRLVLSDTLFLKSLDERQISSGLAEVIKYGIIRDARFFSYLERNYKGARAVKPAVMAYIVRRCSVIKAGIVSRDEREEKGLRTLLNFGHTVGHALEAAMNYRGYTHGEAVAVGMVAAAGISRELGLIDEREYARIKNLIVACGLPVSVRGVSTKAIFAAHYRDKKFIGARNRFVLIDGLGKSRVVENIPLRVIEKAIEDLRED